jgi:hypothetical protein
VCACRYSPSAHLKRRCCLLACRRIVKASRWGFECAAIADCRLPPVLERPTIQYHGLRDITTIMIGTLD